MTSTIELARHLKSLEERLLAADIRRNASALERLLHDDFVEFGSSGRVFDRASIIAALADEAPHEYTMSDFRLKALSSDAVLVTYRLTRLGSSRDRAIATLRSSVWKQADGEWRMMFHQGTLEHVVRP
jgi:hypothetical protein